MIEELSWVDAVANHAGGSDRKQIAKTNLEALKYFHSTDGNITAEGMALYNRYANRNKFKLVGIMTNIRYLKMDGPQDDLTARFVHPWGTPTLIFLELAASKVYPANPVLHIVNVNLRYDDSIINEVEFNEKTAPMKGFTS